MKKFIEGVREALRRKWIGAPAINDSAEKAMTKWRIPPLDGNEMSCRFLPVIDSGEINEPLTEKMPKAGGVEKNS